MSIRDNRHPVNSLSIRRVAAVGLLATVGLVACSSETDDEDDPTEEQIDDDSDDTEGSAAP